MEQNKQDLMIDLCRMVMAMNKDQIKSIRDAVIREGQFNARIGRFLDCAEMLKN